VVVDAAVIRAGDGAQLRAAIERGVGLDQFGAMVREPVLEIDAGDRGGEGAQVAGGGAPTSEQSWPKLQCVGATGSASPGRTSVRRSALSRAASTRTCRLSRVRA
jgi:hypothetical protein